MIKRNYGWAAAALASAAGLATQASAEPVDRGALEAIFDEPVTLSATGAPQRVADAPINMTIISQAEIARSGAIDLPGVLERLANVDVMRTSRGQVDVSIRGYNSTFSPRLLVLLNGRQVYLDDYGMTNWDAIPVQLGEIRQIEVVSGPNTALFGFNAVAGVINIITYDALQDDIDEIAVRVGSPGYVAGSGVWTGRLSPDLGVRLSIGGSAAESLANDEAAALAYLGRSSIDPRVLSAALNVAYDVNGSWRADLEATWSRDERTNRYTIALFDYPFETNSLKLGLTGDTPYGLVQAQVYSNFLAFDFTNRTTVGSVSLVAKPAPAHTLRVAGELRHNTLEQGAGELAYNVQSLSGMWNWQANAALALTTAVRFDALQLSRDGGFSVPDFPFGNADYDQSFNEWSYNLGAVYRLSDQDTLRVSGARGIGSPSLVDYGYAQSFPAPPGQSLFAAGDPESAPVVVYNLELGVDHDTPAIGGRVRASLFWQKNEELRTFASREEVFAVFPVVVVGVFPEAVGDSTLYGVELGVEGNVGRFNWNAQYSWRHIEDTFSPAAFSANVDYQATSPEHVATAGLAWLGEHFEFGADARYTSQTWQFGQGADLVGQYPVDAYVQLNARVAWHANATTTLELSGRDLLDRETQTVGLSPVERSLYLTLRTGF
jgi:outer membrane receptor for ferrienterochelin and colicins